MATKIPLPANVYYSHRKFRWTEKARALANAYPQNLGGFEFVPVNELEWARLTAEGRQAAMAMRELALRPVADEEIPRAQIEAKETWRPKTVLEWQEMEKEIDRMYDLGALGRKAIAFGRGGAFKNTFAGQYKGNRYDMGASANRPPERENLSAPTDSPAGQVQEEGFAQRRLCAAIGRAS